MTAPDIRTPMVAGNWKMNKTHAEGVTLTQALQGVAHDYGRRVDIVLAPPLTSLHSLSTVIELDRMHVGLGAQNVYWEPEGAYTGEVSCKMLTALRVGYVIVGHSERREYFHETDADVNRKVRAICAAGMVPIVCCGESLDTREGGTTNEYVAAQIHAALAGLTQDEAATVVLAYEPIWAIGTGRTATPEMAEEVCATLRGVVEADYGSDIASRTRILYGGSVKAENAALFFAEPNVDGALVGGAALDADSFGGIVAAAVA